MSRVTPTHPETAEIADSSIPDGVNAPLHAGFGSGCELWLARHAEVHADWQGRAYGDLDVPLSSAGEERTAELAPRLASLGPERVLTSPLSRAKTLGEQTAAHAGVPLEIHDDLREVQRGSWQGRSVADLYAESAHDVQAFYADPWNWRGHGGESDSMLSARVWAVLEQQLRPAPAVTPPQRLVITSHYNVVRVLLAGALGVPSHTTFALRIDPGRCSLLVDRADGWHLVSTNIEDPHSVVTPSR